MASPPNRTDLAGTPTVATYKLAIGALYDYVASLLGNGTAAIASDNEKKIARESLGIGQFGLKNKLINGAFLIDQRNNGAANTITAGATIKYTLDRWYATATGANITIQRVAGIGENQYSLRINGAASNSGFMLGQRIESINCFQLKNKNVTVSLKAKSSSNKVITWTAYYANVIDTFATKTLIATGTFEVLTGANNYQFIFNAGGNATNGIAIEFSGGALLSGSTVDFDSIQLEQSSIQTEFEERLTSQELIFCQRYYEFMPVISYRMCGTTTGGIGFLHNYSVIKRVTPTLIINGLIYDVNSSALTTFTYDVNGFRSEWESGNSTIHSVATFGWTASAEL